MVMESCLCTMYRGTQVMVYIHNNTGQSLHCKLDWLVNCDTSMVEPTNYLLVSDISKGSDKMSKLPIPTAGGKQVAEDVEFILIGAGQFGIHSIYLEKAPTKLLS